MAGNAIASGAVLITTDADKLHSGLRSAGSDMDRWGKSQGGKSGKGFGTSFAGGMKGGMVGMALGIGDMLFGAFKEIEERAGHLEDFADNVGLSMESMTAFSHAADIAGVESGTLEAGLQKLRLTTEGPLEDAMYAFAKRLESVKDPGERARMLFETFGKSGVKMGTMFAEGADGLRKMTDEAKALGVTMTKEQAQEIGKAGDAIKNAKKVVGGMITSFLVMFAPMIQAVSNFAQKFMGYLRPVIDWYMRAWGQIGEIAGFVWDALVEGARTFGAWIDATFGSIFDWAGEMPSVQDVIVRVFRNVGIAASYVWDTIKAGAGIVAWVAGQIVRGFSVVVSVFEEIIKLAEGLPDAMRPDFIDDLIAGVTKFRKATAGVGDDLVKWGTDAFKGFGNTAKTFEKWLDAALLKARKAKEEAKAGVKVMAEVKPEDSLKFSGAIMRGSAEAFSIAVKNQFRDLIGPGEGKKQLEELKKIRKADEKAAEKLGRIDDKLEELEVK